MFPKRQHIKESITKREIMQRKASLELSINTIVIMVSALVFLGLAMSFTGGAFKQGGDNMQEALSNNEIEPQANRYDTLVMDKEINVKRRGSEIFTVSYFNKGLESILAIPNGGSTSFLECTSGEGIATFRLSTTPLEIPPDSQRTLRFILKPVHAGTIDEASEELVATGTYVCSFELREAQTQFLVHVRG